MPLSKKNIFDIIAVTNNCGQQFPEDNKIEIFKKENI